MSSGRRMTRTVMGFGVLLALGRGPGELGGQTVTASEAFDPPTRVTLERLINEAKDADGWASVEAASRAGALAAMGRNRTTAAEGWLLVTRWARVLGENQRVFQDRWVAAMNSARLGHPHIILPEQVPDAAMSSVLSLESAVMFMADLDLSRVLFEALTPYDHLPTVLATLERLRLDAGDDFARNAQLALAIALVYDVPPPPDWPHGQVTETQLPRQLPSAGQAFAYWRDLYAGRKALHRLTTLTAMELKFVVDVVAGNQELAWARDNIRVPLDHLERTYAAVSYRVDRLEAGAMNWPGGRYTLPDILGSGGICVDQAYFASTAAKARGVPSLIFLGAGLDGRHAWFGYLDQSRRWDLDAGRYEAQRFVAGVARDPQTWGALNDHELQFLAEHFRLLPPYAQSRAHMWMAQEYLRSENLARAGTEARIAINHERRNVGAWEVWLAVLDGQKAPLVERESALREAARAFQRYPDLNRRFMKEVIAVLRERGQESAAENEERLLARKFQGTRSDLSIAEAAEAMARSLATDSLAGQQGVYRRILLTYGRDGGIDMLDRVIRPFVRQLAAAGQRVAALRAVQDARRILTVPDGSQFDGELALMERLLAP